jgi:hypothetical protein
MRTLIGLREADAPVDVIQDWLEENRINLDWLYGRR